MYDGGPYVESNVRWWVWRILGAVALGLFILLALFVWYPHWRDRRFNELLREAEGQFQGGNAEVALLRYERMERDYPGTWVSERAIGEARRLRGYIGQAADLKKKADEAYKTTEFEEALRLYRKLAEEFPRSVKARLAQAEAPGCLARACEKLRDQAKAALTARRFDTARACADRIAQLDAKFADLPALRESIGVEEARYTGPMERAQAAEKAGRWPEARAAYEAALLVDRKSVV